MALPQPGQVVFAQKGYCTDQGSHQGGGPAVDAFGPMGTPLYAPYDGVCDPIYVSLGGNACYFTPDTGQGAPRQYYMAHGQIPFGRGWFRQGQQIGKMGDSGNAKGLPHVHFAAGIISGLGGGTIWLEPWTWGQGLVLPSPPTISYPRFRVVADLGLKLRVSPGTTEAARELEILKKGEIFTATVPDSWAWRRGKSVRGVIGWVADEFLEPID